MTNTEVVVNGDPGSAAMQYIDTDAYVAYLAVDTGTSGSVEGISTGSSNAQPTAHKITFPRSKQVEIRAELSSRLIPLQTWEGFVDEVDWKSGTFMVRLQDLESEATGDAELAELLIRDVHQDDIELLKPGSVFRWIIGYRDQKRGKRERVSAVVFRRLLSWTEEDLHRAAEEGRAIANAIQWD